MKNILYMAMLILLAGNLSAETQTVILDVPAMYCPVCPITISKALKQVEGVTLVDASMESRTATVTFDNSMTDIQALVAATTNAGFPSSPVNQ